MQRHAWGIVVLGLAGLLLPEVASAAEEAEHRVLTSTRDGKYVEAFEFTNRDTAYGGDKPWSIRKTMLHGGKQAGVELLTIDNGVLKITLIPTRGMSILDVRRGNLRLGWNSPVKEVVHPKFIDLESRGGLGWLEGFNEWMVRCGLEFAGHPGRDVFVDNTGATSEMTLTLHGKIGNIPASEVEVLVDRAPPHRLRVRGTVNERCFFGPKLELVTEVSTEPGSDTFRIDDAVTNHGSGSQEFQLIYHVNYGAPLLERGATVVAALDRVAPMNDNAAKAIDGFATYAGPTPGFVEQVYLAHPRADSNGRTMAMLRNAAGDQAASMAWSVTELPYLTIWKNTAAAADGYVTGLEPATGFPFNRGVERKAGRLPKLAAGETRRFKIDCGWHVGSAAVQGAARQIAAIAGSAETVVERTPPALK
ncbi:MAG: aldose 1-epimerase family protein [Planctomycetes bacterium]|nr:aldose 1-epimerase family protein [Planctomycetota bacterium]